ncbi:NhaP-type Na+/H+ or K+/H+ antiporter [Rubricella aquisinus]|uniref:NhaP-type Na+/H+ or K+/H+ antiporter n=1 Tax=Rubricella aquisinus TaxID=2028108 RepID=A0A840X5A0_9RHOB|nr:sodium:proton antiporter [Rubricella aquisinus]MBB5515877.1 NhaP-type Na+/H+ or K+/H+ antiporter [Rubricella aquisinus]
MDPVAVFGLVGVIGVGAQWIAWRLRMPAIVLMLLAGFVVGPVTGLLDPSVAFGDLLQPMIALAVAVILFEGGLTLDFKGLRDAQKGVLRLVLIGAPLGWLLSALAVHYGAGLSWEVAAVFGGILIVTGPTVIAPLLRQARLKHRPAALLQWEAIVNDPFGALAAVLAYEVISALNTAETLGEAAWHLVLGIIVAVVVGGLAGVGIVQAFRRALVPEYMKVPVLFVTVLAAFAASDFVLHESGLLAVTFMGIIIANARLAAYDEIRRFKEHATVLLVSGVFVLLAANMSMETLALLDWRAVLFVVLIVLVARPLTVMISLAGSDVPLKERALIAWIGPRGVVLVAVAGLFGEQLVKLGIEGAELMAPLAFVLVAVTVVLHGFSLAPLARWIGLAESGPPGLLIAGASRWTVELAKVLQEAKVPVLLADANWWRLRAAREAGLPVFQGDILSEAAEHQVELMSYGLILAASDNDAYNTLICTDLGPEFGRDAVFQLARVKESGRATLPASLGGRRLDCDATFEDFAKRHAQGWTFRATKLTEEYTLDDWRAARPDALLLGYISGSGRLRFEAPKEDRPTTGLRLIAMVAPQEPKDKAPTKKQDTA